MPDLKKMLTLEALSEALPSWLKRSTKPEYNADEIDSTLTTNQFVTASDKDNWNAKGTYSKPSGGIPKSDLSSIVQTSLEKADSALQSETDPTVPSWAKQTNKPSYTQDEVADGSTYKRVTQTEKNTWNGKQNALSTTQMEAVNSGITSEKVAQIESSLIQIVDDGAKNELQPTWTTQTINGVTFTVGSDGVITATTTGTRTSAAIYPLLSRYSGTKMTGKVMSISPKGGTNASYYVAAEQADSPWHNVGTDYGDGVVISSEANNKDINVNIVIPANYSPNNLKFYPMFCTLADWKVSQKFVPHAMTNYELTIDKLNRCSKLLSSGSLNNIKDNEIYYVSADVTDMPTSSRAWGFVRTTIYGTDKLYGTQEFFTVTEPLESYVRVLRQGSWQSWVKTGGVTNAVELSGSINMNDITVNGAYVGTVATNCPVTGLCFIEVVNSSTIDVKQTVQKLNEPSTFYIRHRLYQSTAPYYTWSQWFRFRGEAVT